MIQLTPQNLSAAAERALRRRTKVRRVRADFYDVFCDRGHTHRVRFSDKPADTFAECYDPETGGPCPASLKGHLCYHVAAAVSLRRAVEQMRAHAAGRPAAMRDTDGETETAVLLDGPLPNWRRFEHWRRYRAPEPEGNAEALLANNTRRGRGERVRGIQI